MKYLASNNYVTLKHGLRVARYH